MILYDYFRSSTCFRVRIALHIKNIKYEKKIIHLLQDGGQQHHPDYLQYNPQGRVPCLIDGSNILTQSLAIIEYLDECYPMPPLLPKNPIEKAYVKSLALLVACDMHPLNNLSALNQLKTQFHVDEQAINTWYHHWLTCGFHAFEKQLEQHNLLGATCLNDQISLADLCLIPQVYNANRYQFDMSPYPLINEIYTHCMTLKAFQQASPDAIGVNVQPAKGL